MTIYGNCYIIKDVNPTDDCYCISHLFSHYILNGDNDESGTQREWQDVWRPTVTALSMCRCQRMNP